MSTLRMLACALALSGCYGTVPEPCVDAGPPIEADAGVELDAGEAADDAGADAGEAPSLPSTDACRLFYYAAPPDFASGTRCSIVCPWPSTSGPGRPPWRCDPALVLECALTVGTSNDCPNAQIALDACDPDTCAP